MHPLPYSHLDRGTLLVASPEIEISIFSRSVLLVCEHSANGSLCLIINKALAMELPEEILNPSEIANSDIQLRTGGPLQPHQMMLLHSSDDISEQTLQVCEGVYLGGDLIFLQEAATHLHGPHLRLCFGYSGWAPGLLEREFLAGKWFLHPATAKHVFEIPPDKLWQSILREMGGKYATLSMIPEDLSLN